MIMAAKNVHTEKSTKDLTRIVRDGLPMIELGLDEPNSLPFCINGSIPFARIVTFSVDRKESGALSLRYFPYAGNSLYFFAEILCFFPHEIEKISEFLSFCIQKT